MNYLFFKTTVLVLSGFLFIPTLQAMAGWQIYQKSQSEKKEEQPATIEELMQARRWAKQITCGSYRMVPQKKDSKNKDSKNLVKCPQSIVMQYELPCTETQYELSTNFTMENICHRSIKEKAYKISLLATTKELSENEELVRICALEPGKKITHTALLFICSKGNAQENLLESEYPCIGSICYSSDNKLEVKHYPFRDLATKLIIQSPGQLKKLN